MSDLLSAVGDVAISAAGAASTAADLMTGVLRGTPRAPPPPPLRPPPLAPPMPPPADPPVPPLIICPPALPPPSAPPGFEVWAAQIPPWFWWMFACTTLVAMAGVVAIGLVLRELRAARRGFTLPREDTAVTLAALERTMAKRGI